MVTAHPSPFGSLLKRYRIAAGLTQEELAERARLSPRAVSDLERGVRRKPYRDTVQQLADALELGPDERNDFLAAARGSRGSGADEPAKPDVREERHEPAIRIFLVADIRGYTRFTAEHGDEAAAQLARTFAAIANEVAAGHGGEVIELRGDEALAVFDSARNALRAAVALQRRSAEHSDVEPTMPLAVGIGLDAGEAVPLGDGYRGSALNLAARLCSLAGPGEIFSSETVIGLARRTDGIALLDRGAVAIKGLAEQVRVIQIAAEGELAAELPPLQPVQYDHPTNLPDEPTLLIGRGAEIEQIVELFGHPHVRLVTLTGTGGTGKTRLAIRVGGALLGSFRDGVFFVDLAPLADAALVPSAIARVLGVREEAGRDLVESLDQYLMKRRLLLVLDNFEHLPDAAAAVSSLLDRCRELHMLVTSRIPLRLARENEYPVSPLPVPSQTEQLDVDSLSRYDAVTLFIQRACAVKPDFALSGESAGTVAEICARLDGLPLAIELAAARLKLFPPQALLQRLDGRLTLLTGGATDKPARHQTLRGAIDWSYELLSEEEKRLFARLSVFWGGCTLEAIAAVCDAEGDLGDRALDALASLVEKSLLRQVGEQEPRFIMLETMREYAAERLEDLGDGTRLQDEHARYYLALAEDAASAVEGAEQGAWLERLESERDNLRAALRRTRENGDLDRGLRLALALQRFWMVRGPLSEGRQWLEGLGTADGGSPALKAAALCAAGKLAAAEGSIRHAAELIERSLALYGQVDDVSGHADAAGSLALSWNQSGEVERADEFLRRTEMEARETGNRRLLATSLRFQAAFAEEQRDPQRSRTLGEESLALYRELGDSEAVSDVLRILADAAYGAGDRERARSLVDELLALLRRTPPGSATEEWLEPLAYRARMLGDYEYAGRVLGELTARSEAMGDRRNGAHARAGLGLMAREQGDYRQAAALYEDSIRVLREVGDLLGAARALVGLSDVARDQGDAERVIELCEETIGLLQETGDVYLRGFALHNLGMAAWYQGDRRRTEQLFDEALSLFTRQRAAANAIEVLASSGLLALDEGRYDRAGAILAECLVTARNIESRWIVATLLEGMAGVAAGAGQAERAARLFGAAEGVRLVMGTPRWPAHLHLYDRYIEAARAVLGKVRYCQSVEQGRRLSLKEATTLALQEITYP